MKEAAFIALLETARWIISQAPIWFSELKGKGELTEAGEAAYQAHQQEVYSKPEAQPRDGGATA